MLDNHKHISSLIAKRKYNKSDKGRAAYKRYDEKRKEKRKREREEKKRREGLPPPTLMELVSDPVLGQYMRRSNTPREEIKKKSTVFMITINTHVVYMTADHPFKIRFKAFMEKYFNNNTKLVLNECLEDQKEEKEEENKIIYSRIEWRIEIGKKQQKIHSHILIEMEHTGKYKFNRKKLQELGRKELGKNPHVFISATGSPARNWYYYMTKDDIIHPKKFSEMGEEEEEEEIFAPFGDNYECECESD